MTNDRSLKNVFSIFEEIASNHKQINDFGKGSISRINGEYELKHPTLWVDIQPSTVQKNVVVMNFNVYIMDLVDQADFAEEDIHSDTMFIMQDIIVLLKKKRLISENYDIPITPFHHKFNDRVAGWIGVFSVRVPYNYGECDIPYIV